MVFSKKTPSLNIHVTSLTANSLFNIQSALQALYEEIIGIVHIDLLFSISSLEDYLDQFLVSIHQLHLQ